ncbi:hypothetical protein [Paenibacillus dauci]|uniref:hypothetical protein n=1 Tax=Paenibacillus dauci TaxID=1567106 RepID=UPI0006978282|nr:hypothetical protein [Paenibacillus dauci]
MKGTQDMDKYIKYKPKKKNERLILQNIPLRWDKEVRGDPFSTVRNHYEKAFRIPDTLFSYDAAYGFPYHELLILQDKKGFEVIDDKSSIIDPDQKECRIGDIEIERTESEYLFTFKYSNYCGKPIRLDKFYNPLS